MSGPIAFRFDDEEVEAEYQQYRDSLEGDPSKSDVARELIDAGLAARHRDVYDHVGADEELREAVEEARNVEETDGEAIRRLIRRGLEVEEPGATRRERVVEGVTLGAISGGPLALSQLGALDLGVLLIVLMAVLVTFEDVTQRASSTLRDLVTGERRY